jgi:hypothetical protein
MTSRVDIQRAPCSVLVALGSQSRLRLEGGRVPSAGMAGALGRHKPLARASGQFASYGILGRRGGPRS